MTEWAPYVQQLGAFGVAAIVGGVLVRILIGILVKRAETAEERLEQLNTAMLELIPRLTEVNTRVLAQLQLLSERLK